MLTTIGTVRANSRTLLLAMGVAAAALLAGSRFGANSVAQTPAEGLQFAAAEGPPLAYEENRGQTASKVRFIARGSRYTQFITAEEVVWRLSGAAQDYAVYLRFPGATPAFVRGEAALAGRSNYLKGRDASKWVTGAEHFSAVRLTGLYPGVSFKLYGTRARPEYDFIVAPGADASVIRLRFSGAETVEVGSHGELSVRTPAGELIHHVPVAFQRGSEGRTVPVKARFVQVAPDEVAFELGEYDSSRELVIDPVYEYSTFIGGNLGLEALHGFAAPDPWQAIAVNGAGEVYSAGVTNSTDFPVTPGALNATTLGTNFDFYIVKLNASGDTLLYATFIGGTRDEIGVGGIAVNPAGEIVFAGTSQSDDFPTTPGAYDRVHDGNTATDVVALKINAAGNALVYSTYLGSSANENLFGFAVDAAGSIYVAGSTVEGATVPFPVTAGAFNTNGDQFVTKLLPDGSGLAYSSRFGNSFGGGIRIRAMALDSSNNVYLTGSVNSGDLPLASPLDSTQNGGFDAFITKINPAGNSIVYSTYLGGSGTDEGRAIAVDSAGNMYVAGSTFNTPAPNDYPTTPGAFRTTPFTTQTLGFVTKVNAAGNALVWSTYFSAPNLSSNNTIALDSSNRVYIANDGSTTGEMIVGEPAESCLASAAPGLIRLSADGSTVEYGMRIGGPRVMSGGSVITLQPANAIAVDAGNNLYVAGTTNSNDFPTFHGAQGTRPASTTDDAYIVKLSDGAPLPMPTLAFSAATYAVDETSGTATITVNRTGRAAGPVKVQVQTVAGGTATAGADYTAVDTTLEWRDGDMTPKTVSVPVANDGVADSGETVNLALTKNWCLGDLGTQATAVLTINDAAAPPPPPPPPPPIGTLQLSAATYAAGEGAGNATITVTRTGGSAGAVSARLATSNGTATAAADYTATDTIVNFADGDAAAKTVSVPILQDTADEPDETVNLTLSAPTGGATLGAQTTAVLTVTDDDPTPAPPPAPAPGGGGGGSLDTLTVFGLLIALISACASGTPPSRRGQRRSLRSCGRTA